MLKKNYKLLKDREMENNTISQDELKKLITDKKVNSNVKPSLKKLAQESKNDQIDFLSEKILDRKAADLSHIGIKEFIIGNYDSAIDKINEAIKLDRN